MPTVVLDGYRTTLLARAAASATTIAISRAAAIALNAVGFGGRVYLTLKDRVNFELVQYDHDSDWGSGDPSVVLLPVTRNVRGLGAKNFPYGACVLSEVNSLYIEDYITARLGGPGGAS